LRTVTVLGGFTVLIFGAFVFVQSAYYPGQPHNLAQKIAVRLSMTGLLGSAASGLADVLGYGSNAPGLLSRPILGTYQIFGIVAGFILAGLGVLLFALMGSHTELLDVPADLEPTDEETRPNRS
jgi:urea transporter